MIEQSILPEMINDGELHCSCISNSEYSFHKSKKKKINRNHSLRPICGLSLPHDIANAPLT